MAVVTLKKGSTGDWVKALQYILMVQADGEFGPKTQTAVKQYQESKGLIADGICGKNTWTQICAHAPTLRVGSSGSWVSALEVLLQTLTADGIYSQSELQHVKTYQSTHSLEVDGIVGKKTWSMLFGLTEPLCQSVPLAEMKQPIDYKQYDARWANIVYTKNNIYNSNQTIKNSGCGPTAAADIIASWYDSSVTPKSLAGLAVANGYRTENSGTAWGFFKWLADRYGCSKFIQTSSYATAEAAILDGALAVCSMGPGLYTKGGHYICWWKVDDKYVYTNDPASSSSSRAKAKKSIMREQCKQYFIFYR